MFLLKRDCMDGQQITHDIFIKFLDMSRSAIYNLVMKTPI